ncbi:MAG: hypothetical protein JWL91_1729, partial [Sphingomonas bacterium]|nr:hypothetical protein [Sphingomonas bacterium]
MTSKRFLRAAALAPLCLGGLILAGCTDAAAPAAAAKQA